MKDDDSTDSSNFLDIDPHKLDKEWLAQPGLYHEHAVALADARKANDRANAELALVAAELELKIRENPEHYDLEKPTEASIKATLLLQKEYKLAQRSCRDARHAVDVHQAGVTALDHRKRALTMLVELHNSDYYSDPKVTSSSKLRQVAEESDKRSVRKLGQLKRRKNDDGEEDEE